MFSVNNAVFPFIRNGVDLTSVLTVGGYSLRAEYTYINNPITSMRGGSLFVTRLGRDITQLYVCGLNDLGVPEIWVMNARTDRQLGHPANVGLKTAWVKMMFAGDLLSTNIQFASAATYTIGSATAPAKDLYLQNAVTVVSDRNYKSNIQDVPDAVIDVWGTLNFQMYQLNAAIDSKGEKDARFHIGLIAQDIVAAFEKAGIDWTRYGLVTHEKWDAIAEVKYQAATFDEEGKQLTPEVQAVAPREAGEIYMVRYDECMALESLYQRKKIAEQNQRIAALEAKLKS